MIEEPIGNVCSKRIHNKIPLEMLKGEENLKTIPKTKG